MHDLIVELQAKSENTMFPEELPTEDQVQDVQDELLTPLPSTYREFLLTASNLIFSHINLSTAADEKASTHLPEVTSQAWDEGLPRHLVPIAWSESTQFCSTPDGIIQAWSNPADESQEVMEEWENVWEWAQSILIT